MPDDAFTAQGEDPYCFECATNAKCASCGAAVMIGPARYNQLGGGPINCTRCGPRDRPFYKSASPVALLGFVGLVIIALLYGAAIVGILSLPGPERAVLVLALVLAAITYIRN